jgi:predicted amidohydrolase
MGTHRKINITVHEQLFHTRADVTRVKPLDNIKIYQTDIGKLSGLICGEHYQPLLIQHMVIEGEQIHAALWPGYFDYPGAYSLRTIIPAMTQGLCIAAQNWAVLSSCYVPENEIPQNFYSNNIFDGTFGGSCVINPVGEIVAGPLYDAEGILYCDIDLGVIPLAKSVVNLTGIYDRRDVLSLLRRETPYLPALPMDRLQVELPPDSRAAEVVAHLKERLAELQAKVDKMESTSVSTEG